MTVHNTGKRMEWNGLKRVKNATSTVEEKRNKDRGNNNS